MDTSLLLNPPTPGVGFSSPYHESIARVQSIVRSCQEKRIAKDISQHSFELKLLQQSLEDKEQQVSARDNELTAKNKDIEFLQLQIKTLQEEKSKLVIKYQTEYERNRKLFNDLQEAKGNIRVFCRVRPLNESEKKNNLQCVAQAINENTIVVGKKRFEYDRVFDETASQESVFAEVVPLITCVMDGYNVCIFAYGQTGAGKTYTMEGPENDRGVNYRALSELFANMESRSETHRYSISVSMMEIYNEKIRDLLGNKEFDGESEIEKKYDVKIGPDGVHVPDLVTIPVACMEDVWNVMTKGNENRAKSPTASNEHSSRSHSLLTVSVNGENLLTGMCSMAKLTLVDLAGSERVSKSNAAGQTLKEAQHINKSLAALGNTISALVNKNGHIPYRDSKLTYILKDSLGGDSKTLMIVQMSPTTEHENETLCSLQFASRVKNVELGPAKQHLDANAAKYKESIKKLKDELKIKEDLLASLDSKLHADDEKTQKLEALCQQLTEKLNRKEKENKLLQQRLTMIIEAKQNTEKELKEAEEREREHSSKEAMEITEPEKNLETPLSKKSVTFVSSECQEQTNEVIDQPKVQVPTQTWIDREAKENAVNSNHEVTVKSVRFAESPKDKPSLQMQAYGSLKRKQVDKEDPIKAVSSPFQRLAVPKRTPLRVKTKPVTVTEPKLLSPFAEKPSWSRSLRSTTAISSGTNSIKSLPQRVQVKPKTPVKRRKVDAEAN